MSTKKINEEIVPTVVKKIKKVPTRPMWETGMTVGKLKKLLEQYKDNTPILIPGMDHTYDPAHIGETTALFNPNEINEDYGEELTPESKYGKRLDVIVVG